MASRAPRRPHSAPQPASTAPASAEAARAEWPARPSRPASEPGPEPQSAPRHSFRDLPPSGEAPATPANGSSIQRLIDVNSKVNYDQDHLGIPAEKEDNWKTNAGAFIGREPSDFKAWAGGYFLSQHGVVGNQGVADKLKDTAHVYKYWGTYQLPQEPAEVTALYRAPDMLNEDTDIEAQFNTGKACVVQALVRAGVGKPGGMEGDETVPENWHSYLYTTRGIQNYDNDPVVLGFYSELGLTLVRNEAARWEEIDPASLGNGDYIFSIDGHVFAVRVTGDAEDDAATRWQPRDHPDNRKVVSYEGSKETVIRYVWRAP